MSRVLRKETGQGLVEYALIIAIVAVLIAGSLSVFGAALRAQYQSFAAVLGSV